MRKRQLNKLQRNSAIRMMIGMGTQSSHRRSERISNSFASVGFP